MNPAILTANSARGGGDREAERVVTVLKVTNDN